MALVRVEFKDYDTMVEALLYIDSDNYIAYGDPRTLLMWEQDVDMELENFTVNEDYTELPFSNS